MTRKYANLCQFPKTLLCFVRELLDEPTIEDLLELRRTSTTLGDGDVQHPVKREARQPALEG